MYVVGFDDKTGMEKAIILSKSLPGYTNFHWDYIKSRPGSQCGI